MREVQKPARFLVAGTAKAAGRPQGREDRSPQRSRLGTRLDAQHESPVDAQQRAARISLQLNWATLASHTGTRRKQLDGLHKVDAQQVHNEVNAATSTLPRAHTTT